MRIKRSFPETVHPDRAGEHFTVEKRGYPETPAHRAKMATRLRMIHADRKRVAAELSKLPKLGPNETFLVAPNADGTNVVDNSHRANNAGEYWKYEPTLSGEARWLMKPMYARFVLWLIRPALREAAQGDWSRFVANLRANQDSSGHGGRCE